MHTHTHTHTHTRIVSACFVPGLVLSTASITTLRLSFENSRWLLAKYRKRRVMSTSPIRSPSYKVSLSVILSQSYLLEEGDMWITVIANKI